MAFEKFKNAENGEGKVYIDERENTNMSIICIGITEIGKLNETKLNKWKINYSFKKLLYKLRQEDIFKTRKNFRNDLLRLKLICAR